MVSKEPQMAKARTDIKRLKGQLESTLGVLNNWVEEVEGELRHSKEDLREDLERAGISQEIQGKLSSSIGNNQERLGREVERLKGDIIPLLQGKVGELESIERGLS